MIVFPNCKINLGLRILRKRNDGFHDIETIFYPLPFYDVLEIIRADDKQTSLSHSGLKIDMDAENNLCAKAYRSLKNDYPDIPPVHIHLHKTIPAGAGLGGGSADGAFTLQLLNKKFQLNLSAEQLISYALQLGSDCPFFILNKPCLATGRGEILEPLSVDLSAFYFIIVNPGIHINTGQAFAGITPSVPQKAVDKIILQPIETWKDELINDFEKNVFEIHPEIKNIKESLYQQGAVYASMSGTGSTVFGIFKKDNSPSLSFPSNYFVKKLIS